MRIPFYQVDAFARARFEGNPAAVMLLDEMLEDSTLQAIAAENNLSETAFIIPMEIGRYQLRWFTPTIEVALCGHATLAAAHTVLEHIDHQLDSVVFETQKSGALSCVQDGNVYHMDFPEMPAKRSTEIDPKWADALGVAPISVWYGNFSAIQLDSVQALIGLKPDLDKLRTLGAEAGEGPGNFGVFVLNHPQNESGIQAFDVLSRFFAPASGIDEDPATGSWHCLIPNIVKALDGRTNLKCFQAFPGRGAPIQTRLIKDGRVRLSGQAHTLIEGIFYL